MRAFGYIVLSVIFDGVSIFLSYPLKFFYWYGSKFNDLHVKYAIKADQARGL